MNAPDHRRRVIIRVDEQGRSHVADSTGLVEGSAMVKLLYDCALRPVAGPPGTRSAGDPPADRPELAQPLPGGALLTFATIPPGFSTTMHATSTIDFDIVTSGRATLHLDVGTVELCAGDCVILEGGRHAWSTGADEGAEMLTLVLRPLEDR